MIYLEDVIYIFIGDYILEKLYFVEVIFFEIKLKILNVILIDYILNNFIVYFF